MQWILFIPQPTPAPELDAYAASEGGPVAPGDVLWLVTRMPEVRETPGLCGRLVVVGTERNRPADRPMEPEHAHESLRVVADRARSERCAPFACEPVRYWQVWRAPFGGMAQLSSEQGACLEQFWTGSEGRRVPRRTV